MTPFSCPSIRTSLSDSGTWRSVIMIWVVVVVVVVVVGVDAFDPTLVSLHQDAFGRF